MTTHNCPPGTDFWTPAEYDAFTRKDFWIFVQRVFAELNAEPFSNNWHIEVLAARLDQVRTGSGLRLAVALPPRSLKSIIVSVALPAWLMGHNPSCKIICVSYGQDLSEKLASDCRQVMQSRWYQALFPDTRLAPGRQAVHNFETTANGVRLSTSVGGTLTGLGADVIIVDDPMKPGEVLSEIERKRTNDWARHTLATRLNDKRTGSIILVMQRLHEDDMIGHMQNCMKFDLLAFPAIAVQDEHHIVETPFGRLEYRRREGEALHPDRESLEVLAEQRRTMGSQFFAAQYLQSPTPPGGAIIKPEWFGRFDRLNPPKFNYVIQSWDTASKSSEFSDYSVCTTWGVIGDEPVRRQLYLLHVLRERLEYPELKRQILEMARRFNPRTVLIEDTASGIQLIQELKYAGFSHIQAVKPKGDKIMRARAQTPTMEDGRAFVPASAPWLETYLHELEMFPAGRHDDQVDSTAQALNHVTVPQAYDGLLEYYRQETEAAKRREVLRQTGGIEPTIRLNHSDLNTNVTVCSGRTPDREADGSFLVTEGEYCSLIGLPGVYRMN